MTGPSEAILYVQLSDWLGLPWQAVLTAAAGLWMAAPCKLCQRIGCLFWLQPGRLLLRGTCLSEKVAVSMRSGSAPACDLSG